MKHFKTISLAFLLSLTIGSIQTVFSLNNNPVEIQAEDADYYSSIDDSMEGDELLSELKSIINTDKVSVSYDWSRYEAADEDPDNSSNIITIYARTSMKKTDHVQGSKGWNREHTFPQSKLQNSKAEKDNHIIYASDCKVNGARSNIKMGVVNSDEGSAVNDCEGVQTTCRKTSNAFDPHNVARGIVARTTMYAAAMYGYDPEDNFESIETMLSWHFEYLPSDLDARRNDIVYGNQHNRNPFVDHPEYACRIWGNTNSRTKEICAGSTETVAPTSVNLNKSSLELEEGESEKLTYTFEPSNATNSFTWTSSDTSVATVNKGTVNAIKEGEATITITSNVDQSVKATCAVTVKKAETPPPPEPIDPVTEVESLALDKTSVELKIGETAQFTLTVNPSDAPIDAIKWKTFNSAVATVSDGIVTAVKEGRTNLIVFYDPDNEDSDDWMPTIYATCSITVKKNEEPAENKSCGGSITTTSVILSIVSLTAIMLIVYRKKQEK